MCHYFMVAETCGTLNVSSGKVETPCSHSARVPEQVGVYIVLVLWLVVVKIFRWFLWGGDWQQKGITLTQHEAKLRDLLNPLLFKQVPTPEKDRIPGPREAFVWYSGLCLGQLTHPLHRCQA